MRGNEEGISKYIVADTKCHRILCRLHLNYASPRSQFRPKLNPERRKRENCNCTFRVVAIVSALLQTETSRPPGVAISNDRRFESRVGKRRSKGFWNWVEIHPSQFPSRLLINRWLYSTISWYWHTRGEAHARLSLFLSLWMDRVERVQSSGRGSSRVEIKCVPLSGRYPSSSLTGKNERERERYGVKAKRRKEFGRGGRTSG